MLNRGRKRGLLVIISSPSGAGKTTLARKLLAEFPNAQFSVSYTTRKARPNETHGVDYYFLTDAEFDEMVEKKEFAEWAHVHGNRYGTGRKVVEDALENGIDIVFDVDWQGGKSLSEQWPEDSLKVFVLPPDMATLAQRLKKRASDTEEVIARRLRKAQGELMHHGEYQYRVVNRELEGAYELLRAIYAVTKYGDVKRSDVRFDLAEMASLVEANQAAGNMEHAEKLIEEAGRMFSDNS